MLKKMKKRKRKKKMMKKKKGKDNQLLNDKIKDTKDNKPLLKDIIGK